MNSVCKLLLLAFFFFISCEGEVEETVGSSSQLIMQRLAQLQRIATLRLRKDDCNLKKIVKITEIPFGNSGNNLIEFTHGLWVAKKVQGTLLVPPWMIHILKPFETDVLQKSFCYIEKLESSDGVEFLEITSEDSFFLFKIFFMSEYTGKIPALTQETLDDMSEHFILVYASLWARPIRRLLDAGVWLFKNKLNNNFRYTSAHKRSLEGGCNKLMTSCTQLSDFSAQQLPMSSEVWKNNLRVSHPLCDMPASFVLDTMAMHHRNGSQVYLAFDGRGDISGYNAINAVLSSHLPNHHNHAGEAKFVDMFMAMHGDFFVLNPLSTFSWEIYVIRVCLGLESMPVMRNDFYMMDSNGFKKYDRHDIIWVSWLSVIEAHNRLQPN